METIEVPFLVDGCYDGWRVDQFLAARLRRYSRAMAQKLCAAGQVWLRGRPAIPSRRVRNQETVFIRYPKKKTAPPKPKRIPILYEDDCLIAVNKPAGMLVHPTDHHHQEHLLYHLRHMRPALSFLGLSHRLDRETSGVVLLTKDRETARRVERLFSRREVRKEYVAIVQGKVRARRGVIDAPIGPDRTTGAYVRQGVNVPGAVSASTGFEVIRAGKRYSRVRAFPKTGRLHQIRVHLSSIGHPVAGDRFYGKGSKGLKVTAGSKGRHALHAESLVFTHPRTGVSVRITARVPVSWRKRYGV